jgi:hypothetical protein
MLVHSYTTLEPRHYVLFIEDARGQLSSLTIDATTVKWMSYRCYPELRATDIVGSEDAAMAANYLAAIGARNPAAAYH